jgi:hypothetical protein
MYLSISACMIACAIAHTIPPELMQSLHNESYAAEAKQSMNRVFFIILTCLVSVWALALLSFLTYYLIRRRIQISEDHHAREEANQAYLELNSEEQELFFQSKEYLLEHPPLAGPLSLLQNLLIQEKAIKAWEFVKDPMLTNNDLLILNRCELNFFNKQFECSTQTNLPIPAASPTAGTVAHRNNEVYYFESKIFSLPNPETTKISIGISCKPYPWFRLPGRHQHSICYDSDGYRRYNQPFSFKEDAPFPQIVQGDVIGVGYRVRLGTVFFTRNGKKLNELKIGGHIKNFKLPQGGQIFPIIGANDMCSIHVNLGQMGYVFIEGNVKKWGFAPLEGSGPAPPIYNKFNPDILLERSEIGDDETDGDLSERENDFPPNFWDLHGNGDDDHAGASHSEEQYKEFSHDKYSYSAYSDVNSNDERITLNSLSAPAQPPSYDGEQEPDDSPRLEEGGSLHQATQESGETGESIATLGNAPDVARQGADEATAHDVTSTDENNVTDP